MLEYFLPCVAADLAPVKTLIPATLRVRLPYLSTNNIGVNDIKVIAGSVMDERQHLWWKAKYLGRNAIALRKGEMDIYVLFSDSTELCLRGGWSSADPKQYFVQGFRPPQQNDVKRQRLM